MPVFFFGNKQNINVAVEVCRAMPDAVLIDVREPDEFASGHIPGAVNHPLSQIESVRYAKDCPLFLYCLRGTRSKQAAAILRRMGYEDVRSIGGITRYAGRLARP